jgi:hypothetical protein
MDSYLNATLRVAESTMPEFHLLSGAARPQAAWRIADQGVEIAGMGDCDVTTSKFSTRMGPPSCSPPV